MNELQQKASFDDYRREPALIDLLAALTTVRNTIWSGTDPKRRYMTINDKLRVLHYIGKYNSISEAAWKLNIHT